MAHSESPLTVLYIVGTGRSGSTILDIVLGNHPDIESTGELGLLTRTGWVGKGSIHGIESKRRKLPICSCGKRLDDFGDSDEACPFWADVRREWARRAGQDSIESYPELMEAFDRYRRWPRLLREGRRRSPRFCSYARLTRALFESIRAVSGRSVIVDSSKHPPRALALSMIPGIDLRLLHLVRDPRAVAASRKKSFLKDISAGIEFDHESNPAWKSGLRWVYINLISGWVSSRLDGGKILRLSHEELLENPGCTLDKIGELTGLDVSGLAGVAASGEAMQVGHNIGGNRVRRSQQVTLQPETGKWRDSLTAGEWRLSWALTGWLARRYGYKRKPGVL